MPALQIDPHEIGTFSSGADMMAHYDRVRQRCRHPAVTKPDPEAQRVAYREPLFDFPRGAPKSAPKLELLRDDPEAMATVERIARIVSTHFGTDTEIMRSTSRNPNVVRARLVTYYLARRAGCGLTATAPVVGRTKSTVYLGIASVTEAVREIVSTTNTRMAMSRAVKVLLKHPEIAQLVKHPFSYAQHVALSATE